MLGTVIFFTAFILTLLPINSTPLRDRDLGAIIELLGTPAKKDTTSEESSSGGDGTHSFVDHGVLNQNVMRTMDVIDLIQKANKEKNRVQNENQRHNKYRANPNSDNYYQNHRHEPYENERNRYGIKDRLENLLEEERKPLKKAAHKRLTPNRLLNSISLNDDEGHEKIGGPNEYSKIYVVLDPTALQNSRNKVDLSNLLSSILSQSSSATKKAHQERDKAYRYKGFLLKDSLLSRRFRRESKEMYGGGGGGGGDMEDEFRPKRPRMDHGGGGGGGRTAIPYIRHRGDIYERDH